MKLMIFLGNFTNLKDSFFFIRSKMTNLKDDLFLSVINFVLLFDKENKKIFMFKYEL